MAKGGVRHSERRVQYSAIGKWDVRGS